MTYLCHTLIALTKLHATLVFTAQYTNACFEWQRLYPFVCTLGRSSFNPALSFCSTPRKWALHMGSFLLVFQHQVINNGSPLITVTVDNTVNSVQVYSIHLYKVCFAPEKLAIMLTMLSCLNWPGSAKLFDNTRYNRRHIQHLNIRFGLYHQPALMFVLIIEYEYFNPQVNNYTLT